MCGLTMIDHRHRRISRGAYLGTVPQVHLGPRENLLKTCDGVLSVWVEDEMT